MFASLQRHSAGQVAVRDHACGLGELHETMDFPQPHAEAQEDLEQGIVECGLARMHQVGDLLQ